MSKLNGGTAFPYQQHEGMTLRDYFAAAAMQGMYSCQDFMNELTARCGSKCDARCAVAEWAYKQADAMFVARDAVSIHQVHEVYQVPSDPADYAANLSAEGM